MDGAEKGAAADVYQAGCDQGTGKRRAAPDVDDASGAIFLGHPEHVRAQGVLAIECGPVPAEGEKHALTGSREGLHENELAGMRVRQPAPIRHGQWDRAGRAGRASARNSRGQRA